MSDPTSTTNPRATTPTPDAGSPSKTHSVITAILQLIGTVAVAWITTQGAIGGKSKEIEKTKDNAETTIRDAVEKAKAAADAAHNIAKDAQTVAGEAKAQAEEARLTAIDVRQKVEALNKSLSSLEAVPNRVGVLESMTSRINEQVAALELLPPRIVALESTAGKMDTLLKSLNERVASFEPLAGRLSALEPLTGRVAVLESGDFVRLEGPKGVIALTTKVEARNLLTGIPKDARQLLMKIYIWTGNIEKEKGGGADRDLILSVHRSSGGEHLFPFSFRTNEQPAIAYYTQLLWIPAPPPNDPAFYSKISSPIVKGHAKANFEVIGYK